MPLIDLLFASASLRKKIWQVWYPFLTRKLQQENVVFLNYAYETEPPMGIALSEMDEPDRACAQLYHHVGMQVNFARKNVLEVSCGHGGGASYLARTQQPAKYTGLDLNAAGIAFCQKYHRVPGLEFIQGDALKLPFADHSYDVVVNVEASHCYPDFPKFLREVARVLKPGGYFLYADFRFVDGIFKWETALESCPLAIMQGAEISDCVLRGMAANSTKSNSLLARKLPGFLQSLGRDFAGVEGSRIYNAIQSGELSYRSYCFRKSWAA